MSPEFQHQIERLLIHFVQRNRNFFGEQGRKRMSDVRMLISTSATSVVQGMRGHLTGHRQNNPPFGSPRPVVSWSTTNVTGRIERSWDQTAAATTLLRQQLQEVRGEIFAVPHSEARPPVPATTAPKRNPISTAPMQPPTISRVTNGKPGNNGTGQPPVSPSVPKTSLPDAHHIASPSVSVSDVPLLPARQTIPAANSATLYDVEAAVTPLEIPVVKPPTTTKAASPVVAKVATPEKIQPSPVPERMQPSSPSAVVQSRTIPATQSPATFPPVSPPAIAPQQEQAPLAVSEEDMAIFEQMRHQLIVWLRIEVVRSGKDITGQGPLQLLELLRQHENVDETRLQVVSTLLNLSNQVIKNGQATLLDYKQALTFHLIHTGR